MAQTWRVRTERGKDRAKTPRPLDRVALERLALRYVERFATSRAKLASYLDRKVRERGWADERPADAQAIAEKMASLGYVDDRVYASAKAGSLVRRGYGPRRVAVALKAAGIGEEDGAEAREGAESGEWQAALALAKRRRIGLFAAAEPDRDGRQKAFGILVRAGHRPEIARRIVSARPGNVPEGDE